MQLVKCKPTQTAPILTYTLYLTIFYELSYALNAGGWLIYGQFWFLLSPPHLKVKVWFPGATNGPALSEKNANHLKVKPHLEAYLKWAHWIFHSLLFSSTHNLFHSFLLWQIPKGEQGLTTSSEQLKTCCWSHFHWVSNPFLLAISYTDVYV